MVRCLYEFYSIIVERNFSLLLEKLEKKDMRKFLCAFSEGSFSFKGVHFKKWKTLFKRDIFRKLPFYTNCASFLFYKIYFFFTVCESLEFRLFCFFYGQIKIKKTAVKCNEKLSTFLLEKNIYPLKSSPICYITHHTKF